MIRLIDRYLLHLFVAAMIVFLVAFLSLFLVIDFSSKLPRFLSLRTVSFLPFVAGYYACRLPLFLMYFLPTLTLFAAMFTMIKLQKTNEVLPIVAAGVSLRRLAAPFVVASLASGAVIAALDEFALPRLVEEIATTDDILVTEEQSFGRVAWDGRSHLWAAEYDHVKKEMTRVVYTRLSPSIRQELVVIAETARWDEGARRWVLRGGTMLPFNADGSAARIEQPGQPPRRRVDPVPPEGLPVESEITPSHMQKRPTMKGDFYRLSELNDRIAQLPREPKFRMLRHAKATTPLSSVILLLLGLPFVVAARSKSFFRGLSLCLLVTCAYYAAHLAALEAGKSGSIEPWLAAWTSPALFGGLGVFLFARMRS